MQRMAEAPCRDFVAWDVISDEVVDGRQAWLIESPHSRPLLWLEALEADLAFFVVEDAANLPFPVGAAWVVLLPGLAGIFLRVRTARLEVRTVDEDETEKKIEKCESNNKK